MKKRIISLLLCTVMMLSMLAACGSNKEAEKAPAEKTEASTEVSKEETTKAPAEQVLRVSTIPGKTAQVLAHYAEGFKAKNPGVEIEIVEFEETAYQAQGIQILSSKENDLDIAWYYRTHFWDEFVDGGIYEPLTDVYEQENLVKGYGGDSVADMFKKGDDYYALLLSTVWVSNIYYNMDIMNQNGWTIPTTWDEFVTLCENAKSIGLVPMATPAKDSFSENVLMMASMAAIPDDKYSILFEPGQKDVRYDDKSWLETMELLKWYADNVFQEGVAAADSSTARSLFLQGGSLMFTDGSWAINAIRKDNPAFEVGYSMLPDYNKDIPMKVATYPGNILAVLSHSDQKELAKQFVAYCGSVEGQSSIVAAGLDTPARGDIDEESKTNMDPILAQMYSDIDNAGAKIFHNFLLDMEFNNKLYMIVNGVLAGTYTPEQACEELQAAYEGAYGG